MPVRLRVLGVGAWLAVWLYDNAGPDPEPYPMQSPKRPQYKYAKSRYRVRNWGEYETGLRRRGDLTVWLSDEALDAWRASPSGKPGGWMPFFSSLGTSQDLTKSLNLP